MALLFKKIKNINLLTLKGSYKIKCNISKNEASKKKKKIDTL